MIERTKDRQGVRMLKDSERGREGKRKSKQGEGERVRKDENESEQCN